MIIISNDLLTKAARRLKIYMEMGTIHIVLNTSVKVSGDAHHYLPLKASLKLKGYYVSSARLI